ncbi:hypothetical protein GALMADRAFT_263131 [Galerina marginata CBS 339.88]|uniref:Uncharacterized protein n=1 Tax=Galerina marginata (strain CBS 339.88) TaxID=685588 RepID=A0A067THP3_GALM3|nr:hypothetical protein GALMADRAFT_263131 [Galerina marginata CBS 339.88]
MEPPSKPPLITPSASPPPSQLSYRMADTPPVKRQRLFSTPRRTIPEAPSSVSRPQSPQDVHKEREASKMRLLDVWASLAERYTRRLDEDDIVDIRTGEITRDNGFLRQSRKVDFGAIAAPSADDITADDSSDAPEEDDDEYGLDELDAFAEEDPVTFDSEAGNPDPEDLGRFVPLYTPLDQADAEDLREFMDAERQRKELCGSDFDVNEDDAYYSEDAHSNHRSEVGSSAGLEEDRLSLGDEGEVDHAHSQEQEEDEGVEGANDGPAQLLKQALPIDLVSEDELDNWDVDEASIVHSVVKNEAEDDSDSDIEIIEPPVVTTSSIPRSRISEVQPQFQKSPTKFHPNSRSPQKTAHQLYTPPQSQSSSCPSATPTSDRFFDFSRDSPPATLSSNNGISHSSTNGDIASDLPSSHLGKVPKTPVSKMELKQFTKPPRNSVAPAKAPILKPIVLLTPRKRLSPQKSMFTPAQPPHFHEESRTLDRDKPIPSPVSKGKGKAKEQVDEATKSKRVGPKHQRSRRSPFPSKKGEDARNRASPELIDDADDSFTVVPSSSKAHRSLVPKEEGDMAFPNKTPSKSQKSNKNKAIASEAGTSFSIPHGDVKFARPRHSKSPSLESQPLSRKRKRVRSDTEHGYSDITSEVKLAGAPKSDRSSNHASTSRLVVEEKPMTHRSKKRSPERRTASESGSGTENDDDSSGSEHSGDSYQHKSHSRTYDLPPPHYSYSHASYLQSQHPSHDYPPLPDPRAQFIINQAMQQLSALVGAPWIPPRLYGDGSIPHTPVHHHHHRRPPNDPFITPTHHPHPYSYSYDPNFSNASLPPDSPDVGSSPDKSNSRRRKSLVCRSRSRGRRVSFMDDGDKDEMDVGSSPPSMRLLKAGSQKETVRGNTGSTRSDEGFQKSKGKKKERIPDTKGQSDDAASDTDQAYVRAQTPGPSARPNASDIAGRGRPGFSK